MNSRLMPDQTDAHPHRWPSAGNAAERAADPKWRLLHLLNPSVCATNRRRLMPSGHKYPRAPGSGLTPRRTITAPHRSRQASIPIAPAAPPAISSRDFVPWRSLRRRPHTRPARPPIRRPRNLHRSRHKSSPLLGLIPLYCVGLRFPDPYLFAIAVGMQVVRMPALALGFHTIVFGGEFRMGAQVVSERQMPRDLCRAVLITMKLHGSAPGFQDPISCSSAARASHSSPHHS